MKNKEITKAYYVEDLGFEMKGGDYPDYLMVSKDEIEIHFFAFPELDPMHNYGQVYSNHPTKHIYSKRLGLLILPKIN